jgi:NAD(P)-dependent dehydrogenase (short-subunit alcohol dehydrogenase family)
MSRRGKYVVVTGVSSGIGYATALELVERGYHVFGSVRKAEDGQRLQDALGLEFTPLLFDVTDIEAIEAAADLVEDTIGSATLAGLVNNAGIAVAGPLMHIDIDLFREQIEVNVIGTLAVTQAFLPLLSPQEEVDEPPGRIVNISSVSGHTGYPFLGPYAASKHALEALSDSLRREMMLYGIEVILIVSGAVQTPIWEKGALNDPEMYRETDYYEALNQMRSTLLGVGENGMPVGRVSRTIVTALEAAKPRTRYILTNSWWMGWMLPRWLPDRMLDNALSRQLGLIKR